MKGFFFAILEPFSYAKKYNNCFIHLLEGIPIVAHSIRPVFKRHLTRNRAVVLYLCAAAHYIGCCEG